MDFIARAFMAAWLAGLLALAHAGYDHSLAETYQWAQQLTHGALRAEPPACLCGSQASIEATFDVELRVDGCFSPRFARAC